MLPTIMRFLIFFLIVSFTKNSALSQEGENRLIKTSDGRTFETKAIYILKDEVYLRQLKGRPVEHPIRGLSDVDKLFVEEWIFENTKKGSEKGDIDLISDLVLALFFDENSEDDSVSDFSGSKNFGVIRNGEHVTDRFGRPGRALELLGGKIPNGEDDDPNGGRVTIEKPKNIDFLSPATYSFWFFRHTAEANLERETGNYQKRITSNGGGFLGRWGYGGKAGDNFFIGLKDSPSDFINWTLPVPGLLNLTAGVSKRGEWYHVAATYDGYNANLYVNGVLKDSDVCTLSKEIVFREPIKLGVDELFNKNRRYFSGILDDVLIYNRALNEEEVQALYKWGEKLENGIKAPGEIDLVKVSPKIRKWTGQNGNSIEARLISADSDGKVILKLSNGSRYEMTIDKFSSKDQEYINTQLDK